MQRGAHQAGAAAQVEATRETARAIDVVERFDDEFGAAIGERLGQMGVEARRIIVEQARDIGLGQRRRRFGRSEQRQPRCRALRVARVGGERGAERLGRAVAVAELFLRFAEREQRRRPARRAFQRLLEHFGRRAPVALLGGRPRVGISAVGDEIAAGERVVRQRFLRRRVSK